MVILILFLVGSLMIPIDVSESKEAKKTYVAKADRKYKKSTKKRKRKYRYIGARDVNRAVNGDYLKLKNMVRDLNE
jgi:hypothetical protein